MPGPKSAMSDTASGDLSCVKKLQVTLSALSKDNKEKRITLLDRKVSSMPHVSNSN